MTTNGSRRFFVALGAVAAIAVASLGFAQQDILNDPSRPAEERARDAGTKPLELYAFFGVQEGMTVADMMPGRGYNTIILSKVVGASGKVYTGPDRGDRMADRLAANPLANVQLIAAYDEIPAGSLDVIITVRNLHDLINGGREGAALAAWMTALKPGGFLGVVDARTTMEGFDGDTHRINEQTVIDAVTAAGFELVESSDLLANPDDDVTTRAETGNRYDIDRMALKFRKPGM
jgi:predicted methyltransferase